MDEKFVNVVGDKIVIDGEWYKITNYDEVGEEVINMLKAFIFNTISTVCLIAFRNNLFQFCHIYRTVFFR